MRTGRPCRLFVSSEIYSGDLRENGQSSGVTGADAKCQRLANASDQTKGGVYRAWISGFEFATGPASRFAYIYMTGPYVLVDDTSTVIAGTWSDLTETEGCGGAGACLSAGIS